jgi:hypothetical protein
MKNIAILLLVIFGIGLVSSCEKEPKEPVLNMNQTNAASISSPANGSTIVFTEANQDSTLEFTWAPAQYNLSDLETTKYLLQMAKSGTNFETPSELTSTTETSYSTTYGAINAKLLVEGETPGTPVNYDFRVVSFINNTTEFTNAYSAASVVEMVPFEKVLSIAPIYLLGSATTIGWDNAAALEMTYLDEGKFAIVETLSGGAEFIKFISDLGAWAPQWGTDDTGTSEMGPLVYRPSEDIDDPVAIPCPEEAGDYYILADTANLTYEVSKTSATLFLVGDASDAGWDNANGIPFTKESPGIFTLTTNLKAEGGLKFLEVSGAWAPQWGTDDTGTAESGPLVYRPDEGTPDPPNIAAPSSAGSYLITLNLITKTYTIKAQ